MEKHFKKPKHRESRVSIRTSLLCHPPDPRFESFLPKSQFFAISSCNVAVGSARTSRYTPRPCRSSKFDVFFRWINPTCYQDDTPYSLERATTLPKFQQQVEKPWWLVLRCIRLGNFSGDITRGLQLRVGSTKKVLRDLGSWPLPLGIRNKNPSLKVQNPPKPFFRWKVEVNEINVLLEFFIK